MDLFRFIFRNVRHRLVFVYGIRIHIIKKTNASHFDLNNACFNLDSRLTFFDPDLIY